MEISHSPHPPALNAASSTADWRARPLPTLFHLSVTGRATALGLAAALLLLASIGLRWEFAQRYDARGEAQQHLRLLPTGDIVKPLALGYHHVAADLLWLNIVQVLGERDVRQADYAWLFHALQVVTSLDPRYVYAYDVGGVVLSEWAGRTDWSNALLLKGVAANPNAWRLPFQLGFNAFFHEQEYVRAAQYMARAAALPGRPAYLPELAARLYVEGKQPGMALEFLEAMMQQTEDAQLLALLARRKAEVIVERDVELLTQAVRRYRDRVGQVPSPLSELVRSGELAAVPTEPFGGTYQWDAEHESVVSDTHPNRLHLHRAPDTLFSVLKD